MIRVRGNQQPIDITDDPRCTDSGDDRVLIVGRLELTIGLYLVDKFDRIRCMVNNVS